MSGSVRDPHYLFFQEPLLFCRDGIARTRGIDSLEVRERPRLPWWEAFAIGAFSFSLSHSQSMQLPGAAQVQRQTTLAVPPLAVELSELFFLINPGKQRRSSSALQGLELQRH